MNIIKEIIKRFKEGYKLADDLYLTGGTRDTIELSYKNKKIIIYKDRLIGKPDWIFYAGYSNQEIDKQENGFITDEEFRRIVNLLKNHFEKFGEMVEVDWGVAPVGPPTESDILKMFPHYKKPGYKIEKLSDGSIKVSFPKIGLHRPVWWGIPLIILIIIGLLIIIIVNIR